MKNIWLVSSGWCFFLVIILLWLLALGLQKLPHLRCNGARRIRMLRENLHVRFALPDQAEAEVRVVSDEKQSDFVQAIMHLT